MIGRLALLIAKRLEAGAGRRVDEGNLGAIPVPCFGLEVEAKAGVTVDLPVEGEARDDLAVLALIIVALEFQQGLTGIVQGSAAVYSVALGADIEAEAQFHRACDRRIGHDSAWPEPARR